MSRAGSEAVVQMVSAAVSSWAKPFETARSCSAWMPDFLTRVTSKQND